jgi:hypothetical protein
MPTYGYLCPALESLVCKEDVLRTFTNDVLLTFIKRRKQESLIMGGNAAELKEVLIYSKFTSVVTENLVLPAKGITEISQRRHENPPTRL